MLPSVFEGRAPVLLFPYTEACAAKQREMGRSLPSSAGSRKVFFCHNYTSEYNAVLNTFKQGGTQRVEEDSQKWSVLWGRQPTAERIRSMTAVQKTNHFPGSWHLGDKGCLWKCIAAMQKRFRSDFEITPIGYVVPEASDSFALARLQQPAALWIWKPMTGSCGKGIRVFSSQDDSAEVRKLMNKPAIVQRYVPSPLTINGYKFDMRIYVTVVSYEPLKVYINTEGLVRLAIQKYSEDPSTLSDRTRHLTNYSINKKSSLFVQNKDGEQEEGSQSSKWSLTELKAHFEETGLDYDCMFDSIKDVVVKTLLAVEPQMKAEWTKALKDPGAGWLARGPHGVHASSCFEMYGFDILMDTDLKAWLLEVNVYPSMSSGSPLDKRIKTKLIADTLTLVGLRTTASQDGCSAGAKRPFSKISGDMATSASVLATKAACLANCSTPVEAVKLFDETAWDLVMESHDMDMRRGGFERIYPTSESSQYVSFMAEESYANVVLRKFYEAGGADQFWGKHETRALPLPSYVPQQISFQRT
jgi:tubulin polyglutamylase TTLL4